MSVHEIVTTQERMGEVRNPTGTPDQASQTARPAIAEIEQADQVPTWRQVLAGAAAGYALLETWHFFHIERPAAAATAVVMTLIGLLWLRRPGRGAVIYFGIFYFLEVIGLLTFYDGIADLRHPESWRPFLMNAGFFTVTIVAVIAAVAQLAVWPRRTGGRPARIVALVSAAALALAVAVAVGAAAAPPAAAAQSGDVPLEVSGYSFRPASLEVAAGGGGIVVDNRDSALHDFTIDGLLAQDLPGLRTTRVALTVAAGTYEFYCSLHPDMRGTLVAR